MNSKSNTVSDAVNEMLDQLRELPSADVAGAVLAVALGKLCEHYELPLDKFLQLARVTHAVAGKPDHDQETFLQLTRGKLWAN